MVFCFLFSEYHFIDTDFYIFGVFHSTGIIFLEFKSSVNKGSSDCLFFFFLAQSKVSQAQFV
jgi:hypothetical protein